MARQGQQISVDGRSLRLSNLDKVLYPETGFAKRDVIAYYGDIVPAILPHLRRRQVTRKRYPDGVGGESFFEKNCPDYRPEWMEVAPVASRNARGRTDYCIVDEQASLIWLANLAALELHTSLHRVEDMDRPTMVAFDLDPGPPADIRACIAVARRMRALLRGLGLECFPKTSGGKGLHLYVPLNGPATYDGTKSFAHAVALLLAKQTPDEVTAVMAKSERGGKVFVDWSQNDRNKTTVCVYSLRAQPEPTVSTPVTWEELAAARRPEDLRFTAPKVVERVRRHGDLFAPVLELRQRLPAM